MYRVKEVSSILNYKERTIRQWITDGKLKAVKIGGEWRVPKEEVERKKRGE